MRKLNHRISSTVAVRASVVAAAVFAAPLAGATDAAKSSDAGCRQETRRVAVWPTPPKALRIARFETRTVTVCDGKVASASTSTATDTAKK